MNHNILGLNKCLILKLLCYKNAELMLKICATAVCKLLTRSSATAKDSAAVV